MVVERGHYISRDGHIITPLGDDDLDLHPCNGGRFLNTPCKSIILDTTCHREYASERRNADSLESTASISRAYSAPRSTQDPSSLTRWVVTQAGSAARKGSLTGRVLRHSLGHDLQPRRDGSAVGPDARSDVLTNDEPSLKVSKPCTNVVSQRDSPDW